MSAHYELIKATRYYGRPSVGWVVLSNGVVAFHGSKIEADDFIKNVTPPATNEATQ